MSNDSVEIINIPSGDKYVKVTSGDTETGYLSDKLIEGDGINITILNTGANEQIEISSEGGGGGSTDEEILSTFDFSDTFPYTITVVSPPGTITRAKIVIDTIFNNTLFSIGVNGNNSILMETGDNDPTVVASYETNPDAELGDGETIKLYNTGGIPTQGSGRVILNISR